MKSYKSFILGLAGLMSLTACNDWLDINENPNTPSDGAADYYQRLAWVQYYANQTYQTASEISNYACGDMATASRTHARGRYSQWLVSHFDAAGRRTTCWQSWFNGAAPNIPDIISKAEAAEAWHYAGAVYLLKAYGYSVLMDNYGEIPYTDAITSSIMPAYNTCREVFPLIIADIDKGIEYLERTQGPNAKSLSLNDSWAQGDVQKWIKFGYLLKARTLLHLSKKAPGSAADLKYDAQAILDCLAKGPQAISDNIVINHTDNNGADRDPLGINERLDFATMYSNTGMNSNIYFTKMYVDNLTNFDGKGIEDPRADRLLPWARSQKTANSPAELKWSADGKWRRTVGLDLHTTIRMSSAPYAVQWYTGSASQNKALEKKNLTITDVKPDGNNGFYCEDKNRAGDTIYIQTRCGGKGYYGGPDLLFYTLNGESRSTLSGAFMVRPTAPGMISTYHEACFIKAEVLFNRGSKAEAFNAYKAGVKAHMEQMNVKLSAWSAEDRIAAECPAFKVISAQEINDYIENALGTAGDLTLGKIMTQKRLAMPCSMEQYNDMRRYDYDSNIFFNWEIPAEYYANAEAQLYIPLGKTLRRWQPAKSEYQYNAESLGAVAEKVEGLKEFGNTWYNEYTLWTIPIWWDSTQE